MSLRSYNGPQDSFIILLSGFNTANKSLLAYVVPLEDRAKVEESCLQVTPSLRVMCPSVLLNPEVL